MKCFSTLFLLALFSLSTALYAQNQAPVLVYEAAHCVVNSDRNWLDDQTLQLPELSVGFRHDSKTLLGDDYLYLVIYTAPSRKEGKIFDIRIKGKHSFSIENSAQFVISPKGVDFPQAPVGGQWEQNQFVNAIQQIGDKKWYTASMKYLRKPSGHIQCEISVDKN